MASNPAAVPVYVNVYRLIATDAAAKKASNDALEFIKMGIYHAGVEVLGQEWSFGMDSCGRNDPNVDGIFVVRPKTAVGEFKEQVLLGEANVDRERVGKIIESLKPQWKAVTYHILNHNCVYFSLEFAKLLNPQFEATFPHYVYRAAGVGNTIVPEAVVANLTSVLAPPTSVDPSLINKVDVPTRATAPRPSAARQPAPAAPAATSGPAGLFGMAKGLAAQAVTVVKNVAGVDDQKLLKETHPDVNPSAVHAELSCYVMHIHREQSAKVFVADTALCFAGENKLSLKLPYSAIASLSYGVKVAPQVRGLPPTFELAGAAGPDACLCLWLTDGKMIPLFDFDSSVVGSAITKVTGNSAHPKLEKAFDAIDQAWRKVVRV